jgi:DNA-binding Lrp family transcriptional regulator
VKFENKLGIDNIDKEIIKLLQEKPELNHQEISNKLKIPPQDVGTRINQLKRKKILCDILGTEFDNREMKLARIDVITNDSEKLMERLHDCPYISNFFKMTGDYNITVEITSPSEGIINNFVKECLKTDGSISKIRTNFIQASLKRHLLHINPAIANSDKEKCNFNCTIKVGQDESIAFKMKE